MLRKLIIITVVLLAFQIVCFAQTNETAIAQNPNQDWLLLLYNTLGGSIISWIVAALKNSRFVKEHPKKIAFVLSLAATLIPVLAQAPFAASNWGTITISIATQLLAAVGTHEILNKKVKEIKG